MAGPEPMNEEELKAIYRYATECVQEGNDTNEVIRKLTERGMDEARARVIVLNLMVAQSQARIAAGRRNMVFGAIWCIGGLIVTFETYSAASSQGGSYLIAWGAIIFGAIQFLKGLSQYSSPAKVWNQTPLMDRMAIPHQDNRTRDTKQDLSKKADQKSNSQFLKRVGLFTIFAIAIYSVIGYFVSWQINDAYSQRDCETVTKFGNFAENMSSYFMPFTGSVTPKYNECISYLSTEAYFNQRAWQKAYEGYQAYIERYPEGIFVEDVTAIAAKSLYSWAQDQVNSNEFENAIKNYVLLSEKFSSFPESTFAKDAIPQTYLAWGLDLEGEGNFADAEEKYKNVLEVDKGNKPSTSSSQKVFALLPDFYKNWATSLMDKGLYDDAVEVYEEAKIITPIEKQDQIDNGIKVILIKWASSLREEGDFFGAIEKINQANESAGSEKHTAEIDMEYQSILNEFSQSTGAQAARLISDTAHSICNYDTLPEDALPIFATDIEERLIYIYPLSSFTGWEPNLIAKSPSTFHYVTCIEKEPKLFETCRYGGEYNILRKQMIYKVKLFSVKEGKFAGETELFGGYPKACEFIHSFAQGIYTETYMGSNPSYDNFIQWLAPRIK